MPMFPVLRRMARSMIVATMLTRMVKSTKYQNSERRARPVKPTYCWKQLRMASVNDMVDPLVMRCTPNGAQAGT
jgi:hypothetical protein